MTYVIEPSSFGIGYSIFRLDDKGGDTIKTYIADAVSVKEAKTLCPGATSIVHPAEDNSTKARLQNIYTVV